MTVNAYLTQATETITSVFTQNDETITCEFVQAARGPKGDDGDAGSATGDVTGPASSTNKALAVFDGITGKKIKTGTLADIGAVSSDDPELTGIIKFGNATKADCVTISEPTQTIGSGIELIWPAASGYFAVTQDAYGMISPSEIGAVPISGIVHDYWPVGAAVPQSSTAPAASVYDSGNQDVLQDAYGFDSQTAEFVQYSGYLKRWNGGTIKCRARWSYEGTPFPATNVQWKFEARAFADNDAHNQAFGTAQVISDACIVAGDCHVSGATPEITVAGTPANGQALQLKVSRDVANDDMAADALLLGVWIEYTEATTEEAAWT